MRVLTLLLLFRACYGFYLPSHCPKPDQSTLSGERRLGYYLLDCSYDPYRPPQHNASNPLKVTLKFALRDFKFDSKIQKFSTYMYMRISWKDERLQWDPEKYEGIKTLPAMSYKVWTPGFEIVNGINDFYESKYLYVSCEVSNTGSVACISGILFEVNCGTDLAEWPFDAQDCSLVFAPYIVHGTHILLDVGPKAVSTLVGGYGSEWDITDYKQEIYQELDKQNVTTSFHLERHSDILAYIVVYPSIILSVLTLCSLLMDGRNKIRLFVLCFSLLSHYYFLSELAYDIPPHCKDPPRILLYYRGSFIITMILTGISFLLNYICEKEDACSSWIISINDYAYTHLRYIIWPRWRPIDNQKTSTFVGDWTDFANFWNTIWIVISLIVYVSLYIVFMPHPIPIQ